MLALYIISIYLYIISISYLYIISIYLSIYIYISYLYIISYPHKCLSCPCTIIMSTEFVSDIRHYSTNLLCSLLRALSRACTLPVGMGKCINYYTYIWYSQKNMELRHPVCLLQGGLFELGNPKCGAAMSASLCTVTHFPGNDSHAEDEACARDTNNIKEINTSGYPQFIKLYTVCFSFSFGPRNQKRMK